MSNNIKLFVERVYSISNGTLLWITRLLGMTQYGKRVLNTGKGTVNIGVYWQIKSNVAISTYVVPLRILQASGLPLCPF